MARDTRGKRRAQRKAAGKADGTEAKPVQKTAPSRARQRQAQMRPAAQPQSAQTGRREPRERGRFVKEAWGELKKVEWPGRGQVMQGTVVVLIACIIVGAFLYGADQVFKPFVRNLLLGQ
jgi:preprotein translocase subunit SecE